MNSDKPIITVRNLVKQYGDFTAVNGISFDVYEGEIFGLLGPNGAGKTTTLEIIETLREKSSGEVLVDGMSVDTHQDEIKKIIGVQLQAAGYYPSLNLNELANLRNKADKELKELSSYFIEHTQKLMGNVVKS